MTKLKLSGATGLVDGHGGRRKAKHYRGTWAHKKV